MKKPVFEGTATALVTPFRNGTVDLEKLEELLEFQIAHGVDAVVVCGTTGEAATMRGEEQYAVISHTIRIVQNRCKVIAGTGSNDTAHAIAMSRVADAMGVDAVLAVTPYYNKASPSGLVDYYTQIADSVTCPVIAYNVPSRTGVNLTVPVYREIARHPRINGVKEASSDAAKVARILAECAEDFYVWSGNDTEIVPLMALGAKGVVSVLSNLRPQDVLAITAACRAGDYALAGRMQCRAMALVDALFSEVNPIPIKAAMELSGFDVGEPRRPLTPLSAENKAQLERVLSTY